MNRTTVLNESLVFGKAQISAFVGGLVDYSVMLFLVEIFDLHYTTGIVIGGVIGAIANFMINRHWTFSESRISDWRSQLLKFCLMVIGSIVLKSVGTYLLTEFARLDYRIGRIIADAFVCFGFNYMLQRYWIFKIGNAYYDQIIPNK